MNNEKNTRTSIVYGMHGTIEGTMFLSTAEQSKFKYQVNKPIDVECTINEQFFGEEWVPTPDLWTPLCGCGDCDASETNGGEDPTTGDDVNP